MPRPSYSSINRPSDELKYVDIDEKRLLRYLALEGALSSDFLLAEKIEVKHLRRRAYPSFITVGFVDLMHLPQGTLVEHRGHYSPPSRMIRWQDICVTLLFVHLHKKLPVT